MHNPMIVKVGHRREGRADELCCIGLEVRALAADAIKELTTERKISYEIDCVFRRLVC